MTTVAAVDCGTNSIRLLISSVLAQDDDEVQLLDVERRMEIVRLGQGVDRTGEFAPEALERTFEALRGFAELMREHGVDLGPDTVRMVATSATRDAANRQVFIDGVREILGVEPEVISGDEEAELSFIGATAELESDGDGEAGAADPSASRGADLTDSRSADLPDSHGVIAPDPDGDGPAFPLPFLVVDIGGGSTEFVLGYADDDGEGVVRAARSVDIGCVRMSERHFTADPPTAEQVAAAIADVDAALDEAAAVVPLEEAATVVCVAGTATTVAGIAADLREYDPEILHHMRVSAERTHTIAEELLAMDRDRRAALGVMHPGRVDVIAAGALILDRVVARIGAKEFVASEHDILDGIAWSLSLGEPPEEQG
ncbi:exopolyphosphatase [Nocardiopsis sediminis]|uniref:Exopolyphosphatase n=1 Tax=Nocardiopsis sediminis TaxID=1778267 RepID=A0ABV8FGC6_9ACTN